MKPWYERIDFEINLYNPKDTKAAEIIEETLKELPEEVEGF